MLRRWVMRCPLQPRHRHGHSFQTENDMSGHLCCRTRAVLPLVRPVDSVRVSYYAASVRQRRCTRENAVSAQTRATLRPSLLVRQRRATTTNRTRTGTCSWIWRSRKQAVLRHATSSKLLVSSRYAPCLEDTYN